MSSVFLSGISGFVGSHLAEHYLAKGWEVHGLVRWRSPLDNIKGILPQVKLHYGDLRDLSSLIAVFGDTEVIDRVHHLAAQSYVDTSFTAPADTLTTNVVGTVNLLDAIRHWYGDAKLPLIHICSSSEVYGQVTEADVPIKETCPLRPASPYAVSKVAEDMLGLQYFLSYKMPIVRTRMFTHSVSRWTPVILRDRKSGLLDIKYISEIRQAGKRGGYFSGEFMEDGTQLWDMARHDIDVWNAGEWTAIKHLSCHPIRSHKMLEVATRGGLVDATDNHSIIDYSGEEVLAGELKEGVRLKTTPLPSVNATEMPLEMAWLYGFFVAEGCLTAGKIRLDNKKWALLERSQVALLRYFGAASYECAGNNDVRRITIRKPDRFKHYFTDCYAADGNKRVPKLILNATTEVKRAFLEGYNQGDGRTTTAKLKSEFLDFKTKSPILAAGLCMLTEEVLEVSVKIHVEHREDRRYFCVRPLNQTGSKRGSHLIKPADEVVSVTEIPYEGEVWDFETENHWFHAGIGNLIVHNTGPRRGDVFAESSFALQVARIEAGLQEGPVRVGNLNSVRTLCDVRDACRAYDLLLEKCPAGEVYNIGGATTMKVGDILHVLMSASPVSMGNHTDPARLRPSDVTLQIPDTSKFRKATGWEPVIPAKETLKNLLDWHRERIRRE